MGPERGKKEPYLKTAVLAMIVDVAVGVANERPPTLKTRILRLLKGDGAQRIPPPKVGLKTGLKTGSIGVID